MTRTNFGNLLLLQHQQQIAAALVTLWRRAVVACNWTVASSTMVVQERDLLQSDRAIRPRSL
jgi:hypothetical protein